MELHQLRYLRAVVRTGSVTAAAEAEHVAQPSISKQIRALERELGVPLFHRVGRRVVPTEAARLLADAADRVFEELQRATAAVSGGGPASRLRLGATETVTDYLLPAAWATLRARFPAAQLSVEMLSTDDIVRRVLGDDFDLGIVVLPLADSRLAIEELFAEPVLLAVPHGHRWAGRDAVPLAEALADPDLLLSMPGHGLRMEVERSAQELGVKLAGRVECRSQFALLRMVAAGAGIAFTPSIAVAGRTDLCTLATEPQLQRRIGWIRRPGRHLPAIAAPFLTLLRTAAAEAAHATHMRRTTS
ncbi:MAG: LysR family transcriptional regulator [Chloroflexota bacterium]|nr:LysR family transcriptional regulator [Dehalococcoidia bacterium]MDW8046575.1 LysR family transcriptional regulator [Chloroflexota bacterium]